jgi:hypothetical protein
VIIKVAARTCLYCHRPKGCFSFAYVGVDGKPATGYFHLKCFKRFQADQVVATKKKEQKNGL